jgi:hypothetical protein
MDRTGFSAHVIADRLRQNQHLAELYGWEPPHPCAAALASLRVTTRAIKNLLLLSLASAKVARYDFS